MGEITLKRLRRADVGSSHYLDEVMVRIGEASRKFDGSGEALVHGTWKLYAEGTPLLGLWVALSPLGKVVGHLLGDIETWSGRTVAWITQAVMDDIAPTDLKQSMMDELDRWVQEANRWAMTNKFPWQVTELLMMTHRTPDAWVRHTGFEHYRAVCRRIVRHENSTTGTNGTARLDRGPG